MDRRYFFKALASGLVAATAPGLFLPKLIKPAWKPERLLAPPLLNLGQALDYAWRHIILQEISDPWGFPVARIEGPTKVWARFEGLCPLMRGPEVVESGIGRILVEEVSPAPGGFEVHGWFHGVSGSKRRTSGLVLDNMRFTAGAVSERAFGLDPAQHR